MFRFSRSVLALVAIVGLVAAGCGGSKGTPTPPPISDPDEIITKSINAVAGATSLHLRAEVSGKVDLSSAGASAGGLGGKFDLAGTYAEGDVDIKKQAADLKFGAPGLFSVSGRLIVVDGYSYMKVSILGDKYTKSKMGEDLPVDLPSPDASASGAIAKQVEELKKQLDDAGLKSTLKGDAKVDGKDCYHIFMDVPAEKLKDLAGEAAGDLTSDVNVKSLTVDYYVYKENLRPAKISIAVDADKAGTLAVEIVITKYDAQVNVKAPDPSEVQESPAS